MVNKINMGKTVNSFLSKFGLITLLPRAFYEPVRLQLETSGICNFRCKQCALANKAVADDRNILTYDNFCKIVGVFKYLEYIEPYGLGESFLNKELFRMLRYLKSKNRAILIDITTNGSLINEDMAEKIISSDIGRINISVDGATAETYQNIRQGESFQRIYNNIKLLIKTRKVLKADRPKVVISLVIMKQNVEEIVEYIKLGKELGVDEVRVQNHNLIWGNDNNAVDEHIIRKKISIAREYAEKTGVKFSYPVAYVKYRAHNDSMRGKMRKTLINIFYHLIYRKKGPVPIRCTLPWIVAYVTHQGFVTPCCMIADPKIKNFGNILKTPFKAIWNSKEFMEFRSEIASGCIPDICKFCFEARKGYEAG